MNPASSPVARAVKTAHGSLVMGRRLARLARHLAELFPPGARVLDVGAGSGEMAAALLALRPDLRIEGIDVLVRPGTAIPVRAFDGHHIPATDGEWDACLLVDVLHHCDKPEELLAEATRAARVCVVVKDHVAEGPWDHAVLRVMDWFGNRGHGVVLPYHYWSAARWKQAFEVLGLNEACRTEALGLYPFPFTWLFDRRLHFTVRLEKAAS